MTETARAATAVLGASGYIGQHFARLLADHPYFGVPFLVAGPRSEGRRLREVWQLAEEPPPALADERLRAASPASLARQGVRVAFSGLPSGTAAPVERSLTSRGVAVFSNAADLRGAPGIPLLIPEVNGRDLRRLLGTRSRRAVHVTNPNCSATGLALALAPLRSLLRIKTVHVATYQSLSGAGYPGVPSLAITDNVVPYIPEEEVKLAEETRRLLGAARGLRVVPWAAPIFAHCARVATREGHLEAVTLELEGRPDLAAVRAAWRSFDPLADRGLPTAPRPPLLLRSEPDRPQPLRDRWAGAPSRARGMAVSLGRLRWDPPMLRFFLLSHNAVRGGAGGSVLNAELAWSEGLLRP